MPSPRRVMAEGELCGYGDSMIGVAMTEEERLAAYVAAFNAGDHDALRSFYCDDVRLVIGTGQELVGPQAIIDFYRDVKTTTRRTITILRAFSNGATVAAELESEFLAVADAPDFPSGPMQAGDRLYLNSFAFYDLRDGRYARIRAAVFRREWRRAVDPAAIGDGPSRRRV